METETNNQNQNTPKTKPSAEDKALAKLVWTKFTCDIDHMAKLCRNNGLSFYISGWVEDPVERGDATEKTLKFRCGAGNARAFLEHKIVDISMLLKDYAEKGDHKDVAILCMRAKHIISSVCKMIIAQLNKATETDNKTNTKVN